MGLEDVVKGLGRNIGRSVASPVTWAYTPTVSLWKWASQRKSGVGKALGYTASVVGTPVTVAAGVVGGLTGLGTIPSQIIGRTGNSIWRSGRERKSFGKWSRRAAGGLMWLGALGSTSSVPLAFLVEEHYVGVIGQGIIADHIIDNSKEQIGRTWDEYNTYEQAKDVGRKVVNLIERKDDDGQNIIPEQDYFKKSMNAKRHELIPGVKINVETEVEGYPSLDILTKSPWMESDMRRISITCKPSKDNPDCSEDGRYLIYEHVSRIPITYQQLPDHVIQAFINKEDRGFRKHKGLNLTGKLKIPLVYLATRRITGASGITEQVAKSLMTESGEVAKRSGLEGKIQKVREVLYATALEKEAERLYGKDTKDKIMEMYLNTIYFGDGNHGIGAAAHNYFGKKVEDLTKAEAIFLSLMPRNPSRNPQNPGGFKWQMDRYKILVNNYRLQGYINSTEAEELLKEDAIQIRTRDDYVKRAPAVISTALIELQRQGVNLEPLMRKGVDALPFGFDLTLTVEYETNELLKRATEKANHPTPNLGAVMVRDGEIVAVHNKNQTDGEWFGFNTAYEGNKGMKSAIKLLILSLGLEKGYVGSVLEGLPATCEDPLAIIPVGRTAAEYNRILTEEGLPFDNVESARELMKRLGIPEIEKIKFTLEEAQQVPAQQLTIDDLLNGTTLPPASTGSSKPRVITSKLYKYQMNELVRRLSWCPKHWDGNNKLPKGANGVSMITLSLNPTTAVLYRRIVYGMIDTDGTVKEGIGQEGFAEWVARFGYDLEMFFEEAKKGDAIALGTIGGSSTDFARTIAGFQENHIVFPKIVRDLTIAGREVAPFSYELEGEIMSKKTFDQVRYALERAGDSIEEKALGKGRKSLSTRKEMYTGVKTGTASETAWAVVESLIEIKERAGSEEIKYALAATALPEEGKKTLQASMKKRVFAGTIFKPMITEMVKEIHEHPELYAPGVSLKEREEAQNTCLAYISEHPADKLPETFGIISDGEAEKQMQGAYQLAQNCLTSLSPGTNEHMYWGLVRAGSALRLRDHSLGLDNFDEDSPQNSNLLNYSDIKERLTALTNYNVAEKDPLRGQVKVGAQTFLSMMPE